jgi:hypothetical protein
MFDRDGGRQKAGCRIQPAALIPVRSTLIVLCIDVQDENFVHIGNRCVQRNHNGMAASSVGRRG